MTSSEMPAARANRGLLRAAEMVIPARVRKKAGHYAVEVGPLE